jgi:hypothetical protein
LKVPRFPQTPERPDRQVNGNAVFITSSAGNGHGRALLQTCQPRTDLIDSVSPHGN